MHNIVKRIRNKRGETLVESMASILIFTFASIIMLTMISAATDINQVAKEADRAHFEVLVEAEMAEGDAQTGQVVFSIGQMGSANEQTVTVDVYGEAPANGGVYAYYFVESGASTEATESNPPKENSPAQEDST